MTLVGQTVASFLVGVVLFLGTPIVLGRLGLNRVPRAYYDWATTLGGSALLVNHSKGLVLRWARFDEEVGKWKVSLGGDTKHFDDPADKMGRLFGVPFGLCDWDLGLIFSPADVAVMEVVFGRYRRGELTEEQVVAQASADATQPVVADGGYPEDVEVVTQEWVDAFVQPFAERAGRVVDPKYGRYLGFGSEQPDSTAYVRNLQEIAGQFWDSTSRWDVVKWAMYLVVSFGLMWLGSRVADEGVPTPSPNGGGRADPISHVAPLGDGLALVGQVDVGVAIDVAVGVL